MRRLLLVALCVAGCAPAPVAAPRPRVTASVDRSLDVREALAAYREAIASWNALDREAHALRMAEVLDCYEGRARAPRESLERDGRVWPLHLTAEPVGRDVVRVEAWVLRRGRRARLEPRVVRLRRDDDRRWRVVSDIGHEQHCGFEDGLGSMTMPAEVQSCLRQAEGECATEGGYRTCRADAVLICLGFGSDHMAPRNRREGRLQARSPVPPGLELLHPRPGPREVAALAGASDRDVWAATTQGLWHFDGLGWEPVQAIDEPLRDVHALRTGHALAVGDHRVWARAPGEREWQIVWESEIDVLHAIHEPEEGEVWLTSVNGRILRWDEGVLTAEPRATGGVVWAVVSDGSTRFALTSDGTLQRTHGSWEPVRGPASDIQLVVPARGGLWAVVRDAEGAALVERVERRWVVRGRLPEVFFELVPHGDGWAALGEQGLWEGSGDDWRLTLPTLPDDVLTGLASAGGQLFVGGTRGVRLREAEGWSRPAADTASVVSAIDGQRPDDVWALATEHSSDVLGLRLDRRNTLLHWDGQTLHDVTPARSEGPLLEWVAVTPRSVLTGNEEATFVRTGDGWARVEHPRRFGTVVRTGTEVVGVHHEHDELVLHRWAGDRWVESMRVRASSDPLVVRGPRSILIAEERPSFRSEVVLYENGRRIPLGFERNAGERAYLMGTDVLLVRDDAIWRLDGRRFRPHTTWPGGFVSKLRGLDRDRFVVVSIDGSAHRYTDGAFVPIPLPRGAEATHALHLGSEVWVAGPDGLLARQRLAP